jgi:hypothetical protein
MKKLLFLLLVPFILYGQNTSLTLDYLLVKREIKIYSGHYPTTSPVGGNILAYSSLISLTDSSTRYFYLPKLTTISDTLATVNGGQNFNNIGSVTSYGNISTTGSLSTKNVLYVGNPNTLAGFLYLYNTGTSLPTCVIPSNTGLRLLTLPDVTGTLATIDGKQNFTSVGNITMSGTLIDTGTVVTNALTIWNPSTVAMGVFTNVGLTTGVHQYLLPNKNGTMALLSDIIGGATKRVTTDTLDLGESTTKGLLRFIDLTSHITTITADTGHTRSIFLRYKTANDTVAYLSDVGSGGSVYWTRVWGTIFPTTGTDTIAVLGKVLQVGSLSYAGNIKIAEPGLSYYGTLTSTALSAAKTWYLPNGNTTDTLATQSSVKTISGWSHLWGTIYSTTATDTLDVLSGYFKKGSYVNFLPTPTAADTISLLHLAQVFYNKTFAGTGSVWNGKSIDTTYTQSKVTQLVAGTGISLVPTNGMGAVTVTATGGTSAAGWTRYANRIYNTTPQDTVYFRINAQDTVGWTPAMVKIDGSLFVYGSLELSNVTPGYLHRFVSLAGGVRTIYVPEITGSDTLAFKSMLAAGAVSSVVATGTGLRIDPTNGAVRARLYKTEIDTLASTIGGSVAFTGSVQARTTFAAGSPGANTGSVAFYSAAGALQQIVCSSGGSVSGTFFLTLPELTGTVALTNPSSAQTFTANNVWNGAAITDSYLSTISTAGKVSGTAITSGAINTTGSLTITGTSLPVISLGDFTHKGVLQLFDDNGSSYLRLQTSGSVPATGNVVFSKAGTVAMLADIPSTMSANNITTGTIGPGIQWNGNLIYDTYLNTISAAGKVSGTAITSGNINTSGSISVSGGGTVGAGTINGYNGVTAGTPSATTGSVALYVSGSPSPTALYGTQTAFRIIYFPDASGTVALTSQLTSAWGSETSTTWYLVNSTLTLVHAVNYRTLTIGGVTANVLTSTFP